jgi:hypothetical protein
MEQEKQTMAALSKIAGSRYDSLCLLKDARQVGQLSVLSSNNEIVIGPRSNTAPGQRA